MSTRNSRSPNLVRTIRLVAGLVALTLATGAASAQTTATLTGRVLDPQGALEFVKVREESGLNFLDHEVVRQGLVALALLVVGLVPVAGPPAPEAAEPPRWGWLGVRIRDLSEPEMDEISSRHGIREGFGAVIVEVLKDTPAEAAGLRPGDLVVAVRGGPVVDTRALQRAIARSAAGDEVALTVLRADEGRKPVVVRLGVMPDAVVAERVAAAVDGVLVLFGLRHVAPWRGLERRPAVSDLVGVVIGAIVRPVARGALPDIRWLVALRRLRPLLGEGELRRAGARRCAAGAGVAPSGHCRP